MLGSFGLLTSILIADPAPSSLNTAYPVMGQPPSYIGSDHPMVIVIRVELILQGAGIPIGAVQE